MSDPRPQMLSNREPCSPPAARAGAALLTAAALAILVCGVGGKPACGRSACAAVQAEPPGGLAPPVAPDAERLRSDVYLDDSLGAADALAQARRFQAQGRWDEAAALLQDTSDRFGERLIKLDDGGYVGLRDHIGRIIAAWPPAGVAAYRRLFADAAQRAFEAAAAQPGCAELLSVFGRYFATTAALGAAETIAQRAIEEGNPALADRMFDRILSDHPDGQARLAACAAARAILAAMRGDRPAALHWRDRALAVDPGLKPRWMGAERPLGDLLDSIPHEFNLGAQAFHLEATGPDGAADDWPIFAGSDRRHRTGPCDVDEPGLLWRVPLRADGEGSLSPPPDAYTLRLREAERSRLLSCQPIVTEEAVIVQSGPAVLAVRRLAGAVAWRYDDPDAPPRRRDELDAVAPSFHAPTVRDGRVVFALTRDPPLGYGYAGQEPHSALVCLDARNGSLLWRTDLDDAALSLEGAADVAFDSSPLLTDRNVYAVARRRRSFGFEDCYLYRLRAADGVFEHRTHLGSASTGSAAYQAASLSIIARHADLVYVCTNLGAIAAVSADDGAVRWLRVYPRAADAAESSRRSGREVMPWHYNPVLVIARSGDAADPRGAAGDDEASPAPLDRAASPAPPAVRIVCLPMDGRALLVLDGEDGRAINTLPLDQAYDARTILGVRDDVLYLLGDKVLALDITRMREIWSSRVPSDSPVYGRGVVTDDRVLLPTRSGLLAYRLMDGQRSSAPWDTAGLGGNLVALPQMLMVADDASLSAYVRRQAIWDRLRSRMAEAASDPLPALDFSEVALRDGATEEAIAALAEAERRADPAPDSLAPAVQRRMFEHAMAIADRLAAQPGAPLEAVEAMFEVAQRRAPDTASHLTYRVRFGRTFEMLEQPQRAVRLYQQILVDQSLRGLPMPTEAGEDPAPPAPLAITASDFARDRIDSLIDRFGRESYAPFEEEAARLFKAAQAAGDESALQRVAESYPNAAAAPLAVIARADLLAAGGRPEVAARLLRTAYHAYTDQVDRPALIRKIADAYERAARPADAYRWLAKAAREFPSARFLAGDRMMTFVEYRDHLAQVRSEVEPARLDLRLPLVKCSEIAFGEDVSLLAPRLADAPGGVASQFLVYRAAGVMAYGVDGQPAWPAAVPIPAAPELLVSLPDSVVVATPQQIIALDAATGAPRWTAGDVLRELDEVHRDWEGVPVLASCALHGDALICRRDDGTMMRIGLLDGRVRWQRRPEAPPAHHLAAAGDWVIYDSTQQGMTTLEVVHAESGAPARSIPIRANQTIHQLVATPEGLALVVMSESVQAYDLDSGRPRWSLAVPGRVRNAALRVDVDGLYLSTDGRHVTKYGLEDGEVLWVSPRVAEPRDAITSLGLQDGNLIIMSERTVYALDGLNGQLLWHGTTPDNPPARFEFSLVTGYYVVAVDVGGVGAGRPATVFCYDHRNASGLVPQDGVIPLAGLEDIRDIVAINGALAIMDDQTLHVWKSP